LRENRSSTDPNSKLLKINETLNDGTNLMGETLRVMVNVNEADKDSQ